MRKLSYILDLIKKLEEEQIDYFLITLRHKDSEKKADIFYKFQDPDSIEYVNKALDEMEDEEPEDEGPRLRSPRKKVAKKTAKRRSNKKRKR